MGAQLRSCSVKHLLYGTIALSVALFAVILIGDGRQSSGGDPATTVPHFQTAIERQLSITTDAVVSKSQDHVSVQLVSGAIPPDVTRLTVLTDENCQPDQQGVSHCLNRVTYQSAQGMGEAVLRHNHRMSEVPCLAPGETVVLVN
jgi:hypothetical protein